MASLALIVMASMGSVYALAAAWLVPAIRRTREMPAPPPTGVTILKPLHGAEPGLEEALRSFVEQRYDGPVQILFGVSDERDGAVPIVRSLIAQHREADLELVVVHGALGSNRKVSTLRGLEPHIRHGIVVLADSDIRVPVDYLARLVGALAGDGVGVVTCLYRGEANGGFWARLATMAIDYHFLPGVMVGMRLGIAHPCFGSTIAMTRPTLEAIGGFSRFVEHLADDHAMGEAVRRLGLDIEVPAMVVSHTCPEMSLGELVAHELRWARTIRAVDPSGYAASVITHAFPLALVGFILAPGYVPAGAVAVVALAARLVLARSVDHTLGTASDRWAWTPLRDVLSFAIFVASYFIRSVHWRGQRYRVRADGTLKAVGDS